MKKDPQTMTASTINKELEKLDLESSKITSDLIAVDRGFEKFRDTILKGSTDPINDPLARRAYLNWERRSDLMREVQRRAGPGMTKLPRGFGPMKNPDDSILKNRMSEPEMAAFIRETHPLGAKISDNGKRLTLDDGSVWLWDSRFEHWAMWSPPRNRNKNPGRRKHSAKWDRTVAAIKKKGSAVDPYAVATAQMGKRSYLRNPPRGSAKDYDKAYALYKEFREEPPKRGRKVEFSMPKVLMIMGNVRAISYDTTRQGKTELYKHDFAVGSRPLLCADGRTGQLFVIEGRYHVTPRGIVDTDARGRELE